MYFFYGTDHIVGNLEEMFVVIQAGSLVLPQHIFSHTAKQSQYSSALQSLILGCINWRVALGGRS